jgi:hypothetical protein
MKRLLIATVLCALSVLTLVNCSGEPPGQQDVALFLPAPEKLKGWEADGPPQKFRGDDLFVYMNGGAGKYLSQGFKQLIAQEYRSKNNKNITLELFEMGNQSGAQEMYAAKSGKNGRRVAIGDEALLAEYYLNFRKKYFLVTLTGSDSEKETVDGLLTIASGVDELI